MQLQDRAEYDSATVLEVFLAVLKDSARAERLLKHIRHRTGLMLERRAGIFAFAHLTFQEYLAARAVHEGNQASIDAERLVREHRDPRWQEVIALYCGLAPAPMARQIIEALIERSDVKPGLLAEAYLSAGPELEEEKNLRRRVMRAVAIGQGEWGEQRQNRFPVEEFAPIANDAVGQSSHRPCHAFQWLWEHPDIIDFAHMMRRLRRASAISPSQAAELVILIHAFGSDEVLAEMAKEPAVYALPGREGYETQARQAIEVLEAILFT
jgi:hypothetical protein